MIYRLIDLPVTVKGLTVRDDQGEYNIYLNARLNAETNIETLQHEIEHIKKDDFDSFSHISKIEQRGGIIDG